jgi:type IV secretion system protein VirB8
VRFLTALKQGGSGGESVQHWIATIQYAYVAPSKDEQLRSLNPLGFRILEYRREPEIVSEPAPSTTPTTTAGASS